MLRYELRVIELHGNGRQRSHRVRFSVQCLEQSLSVSGGSMQAVKACLGNEHCWSTRRWAAVCQLEAHFVVDMPACTTRTTVLPNAPTAAVLNIPVCEMTGLTILSGSLVRTDLQSP